MPKAQRRVTGGRRIVRPRAVRQAPLLDVEPSAQAQPRLMADPTAEEAAKLVRAEMRKCRACSRAAGQDVLHPVTAFRSTRRRDGTSYLRPDCRAAAFRHDAEKVEGDLTREALEKVQTAVATILAQYGITSQVSIQATQPA